MAGSFTKTRSVTGSAPLSSHLTAHIKWMLLIATQTGPLRCRFCCWLLVLLAHCGCHHHHHSHSSCNCQCGWVLLLLLLLTASTCQDQPPPLCVGSTHHWWCGQREPHS